MTHSFYSRRTRFVAAMIALLLITAFTAAAAEKDQRALASAASAQAFLGRLQRDDGTFGDDVSISSTASVLLAFIASGNAPDVGRYGLVVRRAEEVLLRSVPVDGYVGRLDPSGMRGHAIITLALAEAFAVETDAQQRVRIRMAIGKLVGVMIRAQQAGKSDADAGGFGPDPDSASSDLLTTCGVVLALRSAGNIGIAAPKTTVDRAVDYIKRCAALPAGFAPRPDGEASAIASFAGVTTLSLTDQADSSPLIARSRDLIALAPGNGASLDEIVFHVQAVKLLPDSPWSSVWPSNRDRVIAMQAPDGGIASGPDAAESARIRSTALALLILSAPSRLLMTFEK